MQLPLNYFPRIRRPVLNGCYPLRQQHSYSTWLRRPSAGFSLIEVLLAMCVLGVALLGIEKMEWMQFQYNRRAYWDTIASASLQSMGGLIQISPHHVGQWLTQWQAENQHRLPDGFGQVQPMHNGYCVRVTWKSRASRDWPCHVPIEPGRACLSRWVTK